jgi:hypothetical protein
MKTPGRSNLDIFVASTALDGDPGRGIVPQYVLMLHLDQHRMK